MRHLFDFGISQEDPFTEYNVLNIQPGDHVLCIAGGGEMPLSLAGLQPGIRITAVDISTTQLFLARLKLQAAVLLPVPLNGQFLGYARMGKKQRRDIYFDTIRPSLSREDLDFWDQHLEAVERGVINSGRFEKYIKKPRFLAALIMGNKNISRLLECRTIAEQESVFDKYIAKRKSLKLLFKIAFHPAVYKNRGLHAQALIHAKTKTGELFFNKFRSFCTATLTSRNYFFQYFLKGNCLFNESLPEYLQDEYRSAIANAPKNITWKHGSLQDELDAQPPGTFQKIHLSNIGDWMSEEDFDLLLKLLQKKCCKNEMVCYRYLQKNHLAHKDMSGNGFVITELDAEKTDRFPFYSLLSIIHHE